MLCTNLGCLQMSEKTVLPARETFLKQYSILYDQASQFEGGAFNNIFY